MSSLLFLAGISLFFASPALAGNCETKNGITSNRILELSASSDTLWMVTNPEDIYALNSITGDGLISQRVKNDANWWGYTLRCIEQPLLDIAYGGGYAVVCLDTLETEPGSIMTFKHHNGSINQSILTLPWSTDLKKDSSVQVSPRDAAWCSGSFYIACLDGGLVRWDPQSGNARVFSPGSVSGVAVEDFTGGFGRVESVEPAGDMVVVTTSSKVWMFNTADSSWDSTVSSALKDPGVTLKGFEVSFANFSNNDTLLYSIASVRESGKQTDSLKLLKYNRSGNEWGVMLDKAPQSVSFGTAGYIYMVFGSNEIRAYRDTLGDSAILRNPAPVTDHHKFQRRMIPPSYGIDFPDYINDILFVPSSDSSGLLWIASSEGLFLSEEEVPGKSDHDFVLIKRAPVVKSGLKQTYARPGILSTDMWSSGESNAVFIYDLSEDAKVSIKVYDYNMDLVKNVISNRHRKAGKNGGPLGRSTVESEDYWDGKNSNGRRCAPGVYYYKITTDIGERAFGKIVVAK